MAYVKNDWRNQNVERKKTYRKLDNKDETFTLIEAFGNVIDLGTAVNAENMNHIEEGIRRCALRYYNTDETYEKNEVILNVKNNIPYFYKSLSKNNINNPITDENFWEELPVDWKDKLKDKININSDNITNQGFLNIASALTPNLETGIERSNSGFTSDKVQWLKMNSYVKIPSSTSLNNYVYINGVLIFHHANQNGSGGANVVQQWYLLSEGDVVTTSIGSGCTLDIYTYDIKGAKND